MQAWGEIWSLPCRAPSAWTLRNTAITRTGGRISIFTSVWRTSAGPAAYRWRPADRGIEADGTQSRTYCTYCYQNGAFTYDSNHGRADRHNLSCAPRLCTDRERAREQMREYFPHSYALGNGVVKGMTTFPARR